MKSTVFVLYSYTKCEPIRNELFVVGVVTLTMYRYMLKFYMDSYVDLIVGGM